jgi:hypothetical protein
MEIRESRTLTEESANVVDGNVRKVAVENLISVVSEELLRLRVF